MKHKLNELFLIGIFILINNYKCETSLEIEPRLELEQDSPNVYVLNLSKNNNKNKQLTFKCSSDPTSVELNLTFTGLNSKLVKLPESNLNTPGRKQVELLLNPPLEPEWTGRYNCSSRRLDGSIETQSWYVYFYPDNGELFVKCPLYGKLQKCFISYRNKIAFKVPCRALHPKLQVAPQTNVFSIYFV